MILNCEKPLCKGQSRTPVFDFFQFLWGSPIFTLRMDLSKVSFCDDKVPYLYYIQDIFERWAPSSSSVFYQVPLLVYLILRDNPLITLRMDLSRASALSLWWEVPLLVLHSGWMWKEPLAPCLCSTKDSLSLFSLMRQSLYYLENGL